MNKSQVRVCWLSWVFLTISYNLITLNMSTDTGELRPSDPPPRYSLQAARADASKQVSSETTADQHRFARRRSQSSTLTQT